MQTFLNMIHLVENQGRHHREPELYLEHQLWFYDIVIFGLIYLGVSLCVDVDLNETEKEFEDEFRKRYGDAESEKRAAAALAASEKQVRYAQLSSR